MNASPKQEKRDARAFQAVCIGTLLFRISSYTVAPTRSTLIVQGLGGDTAAAARLTGSMASAAAVVELIINPMFGRISDSLGRRPFLILAPLVNVVLHSFVGMFPGTVMVNVVDRMVTGAFIPSFMTSVNAMNSDLYEGKKLAQASSLIDMYFGMGILLGPIIGGRAGPKNSFYVSAALALLSSIYLYFNVEETLPAERRRPLKGWSELFQNPLRFTKLLTGSPKLRNLTLASGLQRLGDPSTIQDLNVIYARTKFGWSTAETGSMLSAQGLSKIAAGRLAPLSIGSLGTNGHTLLANACSVAGFALWGAAQGAYGMGAALIVLVGGHQRAAAVEAQITKLGVEGAGMGRGELAASLANWNALLKIFAPAAYGNLFAWATTPSGPGNVPGMPYFVIAACAAAAQLLLSAAGGL